MPIVIGLFILGRERGLLLSDKTNFPIAKQVHQTILSLPISYCHTENDILTLPIQAVTTREIKEDDDEKQEVVFIYSADTVNMVQVKTGIQDDSYILVKSGLEGGEEIVSGPYSAISKKLESGERIREKEEKDKKDVAVVE